MLKSKEIILDYHLCELKYLTRILHCVHKWIKQGSSFRCSLCDFYTGDNTALNKAIVEEQRIDLYEFLGECTKKCPYKKRPRISRPCIGCKL